MIDQGGDEVMWHFVQKLIETLWVRTPVPCVWCARPRRRGRWLCGGCDRSIAWIANVQCARCGRATTCPDCERTISCIARNRSAVRYNEVMRTWLARYKYRGDAQLATLFVRMMRRTVESIITADDGRTTHTVLTYVPMSVARQSERGFDPVAILANGIATTMRFPLWSLVVRTRHTPMQSQLSRADRERNVAGAFAIDPLMWQQLCRWVERVRPVRLRILIVDDVYTTGSTMHHCALPMVDALAQGRGWTIPTVFESVTWAR